MLIVSFRSLVARTVEVTPDPAEATAGVVINADAPSATTAAMRVADMNGCKVAISQLGN
jgi:hypothetical protein